MRLSQSLLTVAALALVGGCFRASDGAFDSSGSTGSGTTAGTGGSGSTGTSGNGLVTFNSAPFPVRSAYATCDFVDDGGPCVGIRLLVLSNNMTCAQFAANMRASAFPPGYALTFDAVRGGPNGAPRPVAPDTYEISASGPDGGLYSTVSAFWGGGFTDGGYMGDAATSGTVTLINVGLGIPLQGSFDWNMTTTVVVNGVGVPTDAGELSGTFDVPYCAIDTH